MWTNLLTTAWEGAVLAQVTVALGAVFVVSLLWMSLGFVRGRTP
ncbi:MAG: hypothetical protein V3U11_11700 [Planctomycetota bacterium]